MLGITTFNGPEAYIEYCEMEKRLQLAAANDKNLM